jgi:MerR family transcriptional regulator, copper efflux regulator
MVSVSRMKIGDLAARAGVSHRTVHYYERIGLLSPADREGAGYRYYDETSLKRLEKISALKQLGLSLEDIRAVIDLYFLDPSGIKGKERVLQILQDQLAITKARISELSIFRSELEANIETMKERVRKAKSV